MRTQRPPMGGITGELLDFAARIKGEFIFKARTEISDHNHERVAFTGTAGAMMSATGQCLRNYKHCGRFATCKDPSHHRAADWTDYWIDAEYYEADHDYQQNVDASMQRLLHSSGW